MATQDQSTQHTDTQTETNTHTDTHTQTDTQTNTQTNTQTIDPQTKTINAPTTDPTEDTEPANIPVLSPKNDAQVKVKEPAQAKAELETKETKETKEKEPDSSDSSGSDEQSDQQQAGPQAKEPVKAEKTKEKEPQTDEIQKPDLKDVFGANYDEQESESSSSDDSEMEIDEKAKALVSQDKRKQTTAPDSDQKTNIKVEIAKPLPLPLARYSRRARTKPTLVTHTPPALPTNAKLVLARLPKILAIETKPFVVEDFRNSADTDTHTHTRIPPMVARWRYARDSDNNLIKESNARLVKWSDGSLQLMIGKEALRVAEHPIHMQKIYLLSDVQLPPHTSKRTKLRQFYGAFASKMFFSPTTHSLMRTAYVPTKTRRMQTALSVPLYAVASQNDQLLNEKRIQWEKEQSTMASKRRRKRRKYDVPAGNRDMLDADFLEYGQRDASSTRNVRDYENEEEKGRRLMNLKRGDMSDTHEQDSDSNSNSDAHSITATNTNSTRGRGTKRRRSNDY